MKVKIGCKCNRSENTLKKGDYVEFSERAYNRLMPENHPFWKRRKKGVVIGESKWPWCVVVKWIEGEPAPIKAREDYTVEYLKKIE